MAETHTRVFGGSVASSLFALCRYSWNKSLFARPLAIEWLVYQYGFVVCSRLRMQCGRDCQSRENQPGNYFVIRNVPSLFYDLGVPDARHA